MPVFPTLPFQVGHAQYGVRVGDRGGWLEKLFLVYKMTLHECVSVCMYISLYI